MHEHDGQSGQDTPGSTATVLDLQGARDRQGLVRVRARLEQRQRDVQAAVDALWRTGGVFTPAGTRSGRALLRAQQLLQRGTRVLEDLSGAGAVPAPRAPETRAAALRSLEVLLNRSDTLRAHAAASAAGGGGGRGSSR